MNNDKILQQSFKNIEHINELKKISNSEYQNNNYSRLKECKYPVSEIYRIFNEMDNSLNNITDLAERFDENTSELILTLLSTCSKILEDRPNNITFISLCDLEYMMSKTYANCINTIQKELINKNQVTCIDGTKNMN